MARVMAIANAKGGVGKTTTAAALGAALTALGRRVLLIDLDAQASLTYALGVDAGSVTLSVADVLLDGTELVDATVTTAEGMCLLPAEESLAGVDATLMRRPNRDHVLAEVLRGVDADDVLIDCAPSLGVLTLNALTAADQLIVPMTAEMLSHRAVGQMLDTVEDVRRLLNPRLTVTGVLPTMMDARTAHARDVVGDVGERYGVVVLHPVPRSIRVAEAPARGRSVMSVAPRSSVAAAYRALAGQLVS